MKKIVVIGELCHDVFIYGECKRLSPEAPVPVLTPIEKHVSKGMAGNVERNIKAITNEYEIDCIHQQEVIVKTRYVDKSSNHMFLRVDEEEYETMSQFTLTESRKQLIKQADAVIVSDYNKGFLTEEILYEIATIANKSFLDTKKKLSPETILAYTFVKLNEEEFNKNQTSEPVLLSKMIATLGNKGAKYMNTLYPVQAKETIDVSGAGDTFLAAFAVRYLQEGDVSNSITFANEMCSIVVSKRGVSTL